MSCVKSVQKEPTLLASGNTEEWWKYIGFASLCGGAKSSAPVDCLKQGLKNKDLLHYDKEFQGERLSRFIELCGAGYDTRDFPEKFPIPEKQK